MRLYCVICTLVFLLTCAAAHDILAQVSLIGRYDTSGRTIGVTTAGDYAYVADEDSGLQIIDISDPTSPSLIGRYDTPGKALNVAVSGNYAYVAGGLDGLLIVDISDPRIPSLVMTYQTPNIARDVTLAGSYAYVADALSGLQIIDISNPASPCSVGSFDTPDWAWSVAVAGDYAYVADDESGLQIIDISNTTSPSLVGSYETPDDAEGVSVAGDYAYVCIGISPLQIIDVSNPASPTLVGSYSHHSFSRNVAVEGGYAYIAAGYAGLHIIDISNPYFPSFTGSYLTSHIAWDVAVDGNYIFVASTEAGLIILEYTPFEIVTESLPDGMQGCTYEETIVITGGVLPLSWSVVSGNLPPGLTLDSNTGVILGCPESSGDFCFTIQVEDDEGVSTSREYCLTVEKYDGIIGDSNCDDAITPGDALCVFWRSILGEFQDECECECSEAAAEVNCDGSITPGDALCIFWRSILGDWTEECQCPRTKANDLSQSAMNLKIGSVEDVQGKQIRIPVIVDNPHELKALSMRLTYPTGLLIFQDVLVTEATKGWTVLDGVEISEGVISFGGFHTKGIVSEDEISIAEVLFKIRDDAAGSGELNVIELTDDLAGVRVEKGNISVQEIPTDYSLMQNYPNPFNPETEIAFRLPEAAKVTLTVFSILGQVVEVLVDSQFDAGHHKARWNGKNVASGVYFYNIEANDFTATKKMILMQ